MIKVIIDKSGKFKYWHEETKGKSSKYTIDGEQKGINPQPRKEKVQIKQVSTYLFKPDDLTKGVEERWATDEFQKRMKNTNNAKRKGKYALFKSKIPLEYLVYSKVRFHWNIWCIQKHFDFFNSLAANQSCLITNRLHGRSTLNLSEPFQ